jgi:hypothetical protein
MIEGDTLYTADNGMAKISGIYFTGAPGSTYKIAFEGNGIDEDKP